jgi:hypothetical protein
MVRPTLVPSCSSLSCFGHRLVVVRNVMTTCILFKDRVRMLRTFPRDIRSCG